MRAGEPSYWGELWSVPYSVLSAREEQCRQR